MQGAIITTPRLTLRRLTSADVAAMEPVLGDPLSMRYYPHPFSRDETAAWIDRQIMRYERDGFGLWAVVLRRTGAVIGDCGPVMQVVDDVDEVELGWHIHPAHQNAGIATEAGAACRDHAFRTLGVARLVSLVRPENTPSCRVAEKIGMTVEKETLFGPQGWVHRVYVLAAHDENIGPGACAT